MKNLTPDTRNGMRLFLSPDGAPSQGQTLESFASPTGGIFFSSSKEVKPMPNHSLVFGLCHQVNVGAAFFCKKIRQMYGHAQ
jgi:hypothetical protein